MNNVNDVYFDGAYKEMWRAMIPEEFTGKEVDFMQTYFDLKPGSRVLDLMCGYGRHAIQLARRGILVTAIDNLDDYILEINRVAEDEAIPVTAVKADVVRYELKEKFDLALCMGNSLNFFAPTDAARLLRNVQEHLKPGGHLLVNTWSLAEIVIRNFVANTWNEVNGIKHICSSKYLFHPTRVESESTFLSGDGSIEKKTAVDYVFSVAEIETLLQDAGFEVKEIYSMPGKRKFALGDSRAYIIAKKLEKI